MSTRTAIICLIMCSLFPGPVKAQKEVGTAKLTEQHRMLARSNGTWTGEVTLWFAPGQPPLKSTSRLRNYMSADGLYQISEVMGNINGEGKPFSGLRITGYDSVRNVFTRAMIGEDSPGVAMEGKWDEASKSFSMPFVKKQASGKESLLREVYTFLNDDEEILEIFDTAAVSDGKEFRMLKIIWRREK